MDNITEKAILYDATKCTACRGCQVSCKQWNENDEYIPSPTDSNGVLAKNWGSYENPPDLSPSTWIKIRFTEIETGGKIRWLFTRQACMHCTEAGCIKACPTGSLYHHEFGFVTYNKDTCSGCGYCIDACPFSVPRSTPNILTGIAKIDKCTFCTTQGLDRIDEGWEPACVKTCPSKALKYGDRAELVATGNKRIQELREKGWTNANLYGEKELGGLHVLYVLDDFPSVYGLPVAPQISAVTITSQDFIKPLGWVVGGLTIIGLGMNYLTARANTRNEEELAHQEIEKYRKPVRVVHWLHSGAFVLLFLTGLILFIPGLGFLAEDSWTHLIHRIAAVIFIIVPIIYLIINPKAVGRGLRKAFTWNRADIGWLKMAPRYYFMQSDEKGMPPPDAMNPGQKMWWLMVIVFGILFVITGTAMWFGKTSAPPAVIQWMTFVHDVSFIATGCMFLVHIYLGMFHPLTTGAWKSMTSGKISSEYAQEATASGTHKSLRARNNRLK